MGGSEGGRVLGEPPFSGEIIFASLRRAARSLNEQSRIIQAQIGLKITAKIISDKVTLHPEWIIPGKIPWGMYLSLL